jgi:plastocyanin
MPNAKRTLTLSSLAALVTFSVVASGQTKGNIRGKITGHEKLIPDVYIEAAKPEAHRYTWREPSPTVRPEFRVLAANASREVCIAALGSGGGPHEPILVKATGGRTIPATLVVAPGTRLQFKNSDPFPHRLYQVGDAKWSANTMSAGGTRDWAAAGPGRFEFRDELFPSVRTYVVVEPNVIDCVYPARDGSFNVALPPGDYTLRAYFAGRPVGKEITGLHIDDKGKGVDLKEPLNVGGDAK